MPELPSDDRLVRQAREYDKCHFIGDYARERRDPQQRDLQRKPLQGGARQGRLQCGLRRVPLPTRTATQPSLSGNSVDNLFSKTDNRNPLR